MRADFMAGVEKVNDRPALKAEDVIDPPLFKELGDVV